MKKQTKQKGGMEIGDFSSLPIIAAINWYAFVPVSQYLQQLIGMSFRPPWFRARFLVFRQAPGLWRPQVLREEHAGATGSHGEVSGRPLEVDIKKRGTFTAKGWIFSIFVPAWFKQHACFFGGSSICWTILFAGHPPANAAVLVEVPFAGHPFWGSSCAGDHLESGKPGEEAAACLYGGWDAAPRVQRLSGFKTHHVVCCIYIILYITIYI